MTHGCYLATGSLLHSIGLAVSGTVAHRLVRTGGPWVRGTAMEPRPLPAPMFGPPASPYRHLKVPHVGEPTSVFEFPRLILEWPTSTATVRYPSGTPRILKARCRAPAWHVIYVGRPVMLTRQ